MTFTAACTTAVAEADGSDRREAGADASIFVMDSKSKMPFRDSTNYPITANGTCSAAVMMLDKPSSASVHTENLPIEVVLVRPAYYSDTLNHQASDVSSLAFEEAQKTPRHLMPEFIESERITSTAMQQNTVSLPATEHFEATTSGEDPAEKMQSKKDTLADITPVSSETLDLIPEKSVKKMGGVDPLLWCKGSSTNDDMLQHLYHVEIDTHVMPYMNRQRDITIRMRAILVDWLVSVHKELGLLPETLYLSVQIFDRYCSRAIVPRKKLQLAGITALFLACKYEEVYPAKVGDFVYMTDGEYDRQALLKMEKNMLRVLDWRIALPTAYLHLGQFLRLTEASPMARHAAGYYLERTLQEHDLLEYRPSMVSASAVILALNNPDIAAIETDYKREHLGLPQILMEYTGFDKYELWDCMSLIATVLDCSAPNRQKLSISPQVCASTNQLNAVKQKYENKQYLSVSSVIGPPGVRFVKENMRNAAVDTSMSVMQNDIVKYLTFQDLIYKDKGQNSSACVIM